MHRTSDSSGFRTISAHTGKPDVRVKPAHDELVQKRQRCALATMKSRNTCTRATDFNSSG